MVTLKLVAFAERTMRHGDWFQSLLLFYSLDDDECAYVFSVFGFPFVSKTGFVLNKIFLECLLNFLGIM